MVAIEVLLARIGHQVVYLLYERFRSRGYLSRKRSLPAPPVADAARVQEVEPRLNRLVFLRSDAFAESAVGTPEDPLTLGHDEQVPVHERRRRAAIAERPLPGREHFCQREAADLDDVTGVQVQVDTPSVELDRRRPFHRPLNGCPSSVVSSNMILV